MIIYVLLLLLLLLLLGDFTFWISLISFISFCISVRDRPKIANMLVIQIRKKTKHIGLISLQS